MTAPGTVEGSVLEGADAETASAPLLDAGRAVGEQLASWRAHVADPGRDLEGVSNVFLVGRDLQSAGRPRPGILPEASRPAAGLFGLDEE